MEQAGCVNELRQYKRIKTRRAAQLSVDGVWHECIMLDVSEGGARLLADLSLAEGQAVVLAEEDLGLLAGTIQRSDGDGLSVLFGVSGDEKQDLIERLTAFLNAHRLT